jgi:hypothetical protein
MDSTEAGPLLGVAHVASGPPSSAAATTSSVSATRLKLLRTIADSPFPQQQLMMARYFMSQTDLAVPMFIIWVASFGGSLHTAVTTFYLFDLGLNEVGAKRRGALPPT